MINYVQLELWGLMKIPYFPQDDFFKLLCCFINICANMGYI